MVTIRKAELKQREGRTETMGMATQLEGLKLGMGWELPREEGEGCKTSLK